MKTNTIITIGRQYGSAGREIGYKIAEDFGIKLYDKEMLARAAKESGICEEIFETHDEKPTNSFLYSLVMDILWGMLEAHIMICRSIIKYSLHSLIRLRRLQTKVLAFWLVVAQIMRWNLMIM